MTPFCTGHSAQRQQFLELAAQIASESRRRSGQFDPADGRVAAYCLDAPEVIPVGSCAEHSETGFPVEGCVERYAHKEMEGEPFQMEQRWYYVSKTRKHGRNSMWVGPFESAIGARKDADAVASSNTPSAFMLA